MGTALLACSQPALATGRALLIGIQGYSTFGDVWYDLDGPFHDVELVATVLERKFGFAAQDISILKDATRAQIEDAFGALVAATRPGDPVYVHYSGHGSRVRDANGDEAAGGFDSTLVPIDARENDRGEILDDEISLWLHELRQRTADVVFVVDACHSGTISRAGGELKVRGAPIVDTRSYAWSQDLAPALRAARERSFEDRYVRLSACLDSQRAKEDRSPDGRIYGLLTWYWCQALMESRPTDTYGTIARRVQAQIFRERSNLQTPQIEGQGDAVLFAGVARELPRLLAVRDVQSTTIRLDGGLLQRVAVGSTFASAGEEPTLVELTSVQATSSEGRLVSGPPPQTGDLLIEKARAHLLPPFRVLVDSAIPPAVLQPLRASLDPGRGLELAGEPPFDAALRLAGDDLVIVDERGDPYGAGLLRSSLLTTPLAGGKSPLIRALRRCFELRDVMEVTRSHLRLQPDVQIDLLRLRCAKSQEDESCYEPLVTLDEAIPTLGLEAGTRLAFRIRNDSLQTLYFYLFNFSPDGRASQFFPPDGEDSHAEVWSGEEMPPWHFAVELAEADTGSLDSYVWFITREPADLRFLSSDTAVASRGASSAVERLVQGFGGRVTRGSTAVTLRTDDLATRMISLEVRAVPSP